MGADDPRGDREEDPGEAGAGADPPRTVLVVEDDAAVREALREVLAGMGYHVESAPSAEAALEVLARDLPDVVLADLRLSGMTGTELCRRIRDEWPGLPTVVVTAYGSLESAVEALRSGAVDFLTKPVRVAELVAALESAIRHSRLRRESEEAGAEAHPGVRILGESPLVRELEAELQRAARSDLPVLLVGETGTGKELAARELHAAGRRSGGPMVAVNCAAIPEALFESELFGHARGAFTDAQVDRKGLLLEADGGTLFLDEVGDMPQGVQAKLLRALQEQKARPVGGDKERAFDVRIVAATHRDLAALRKEGSFRDDLYYRLDVVRIRIPPLRERGGDVALLARSFLREVARAEGVETPDLTDAAASALCAYPWPGNIRELQNCMARLVVLRPGATLRVRDLPEEIRLRAAAGATAATELRSVREVVDEHIARVLAATGGNKRAAARILGIDRGSLYRRLARSGKDEVPSDPP